MIACLSCHAETSNGLALCDMCRTAGSTCLEYIPIHFGNLARWRPGQAGARPVPGSREPKGAFGGGSGDRVGRCLDEVGNELTNYARRLADDRGVDIPYAADEHNSVRVACWLLNEHLTSVSTLEWCGDMVRDLQGIERRLGRLAEQVVPGWYAGACKACGLSTYVRPGVSWVTCSHSVLVADEDGRRRLVDMGCGLRTYARDHLEVVLNEARGWQARPKAIAEALVALLDSEMSVPKLYDRIRFWASGGQVDPIYATKRDYEWSDEAGKMIVTEQETGHARYRLGQVLDLVLRDTRALDSAKEPRSA